MYRYICIFCMHIEIAWLHRWAAYDGEATSATHKQLSDGTGRSSAAGKSDEGCDGNTFFFLPLLLVRGSAFGYTGWKSYEFQGKCCAANAAKREKERERDTERVRPTGLALGWLSQLQLAVGRRPSQLYNNNGNDVDGESEESTHS